MSYARRHSTNVCPGNRVRYNTLCPICLLEFSREDATAKNGRASIEHVPPLKAGKPHIRVLTCKNCNIGLSDTRAVRPAQSDSRLAPPPPTGRRTAPELSGPSPSGPA